MEAQWLWVKCCCNTTHKPKPHIVEWMRNGQKKWHVFWGMSGNTQEAWSEHQQASGICWRENGLSQNETTVP